MSKQQKGEFMENKIVSMSNDIENKKELLKATICKGASDDEFELFVHACKRTGLDPFMKQVYAVKRWDSSLGRQALTIQTSIDGFRLIAERTGRYSPGKETKFEYDENKNLISATAYVKKMTADGTWHEVSATAFFEEYAQKSKEGKLTSFWAKMPKTMLAKCSEALALRRGFPAELSGLYTTDEMQQANSKDPAIEVVSAVEYLSHEQLDEIEELIGNDAALLSKILGWLKIESLAAMPTSRFAACKAWVEKQLTTQEAAHG